MRHKARDRRQWLLNVIGASGVLAVTACIAFKITSDDKFKREATNWRARGVAMGLPDKPADMNKVMVGANAADFYNRAFYLIANPELTALAARLNSPIDWAKAEKLIAENVEYYEAIVAGSRTKQISFGHKYYDLSGSTYPELPQLKQAARALILRALVRAHNQNVRGAFDDLIEAMHVAVHISEVPIFLGSVLKISAASEVCEAAARIMANSDGSPEAVTGARKVLNAWQKVNLTHAIKESWLFALQSPHKIITLYKDQGVLPNVSVEYEAALLLASPYEIQSMNLKSILRCIEIAEDNSMTPFEKYNLTAAKEAEAISNCSPPSRLFAGVARQCLCDIYYPLARDVSQVNLLATAADVYEYRNRTGGLPKHLEAIGVRRDVWSNGPLGYRVEKTGFRVWGMGENGIDDGGTDDKTWNSPDHVLIMAKGSTSLSRP